MEYRQKILDLIANGTQEDMHTWLNQQPPLDQVDIMKEMQDLAGEIAEETNDDSIGDLEELGTLIDNYKEAVLNEQLALLKQEIAERELEKHLDEVDAMIQDIRNKVSEGIMANDANSDTFKQLAEELISGEKKAGFYNPANWKHLD